MKELDGFDKATPEQRKEVSKILFNGRLSILGTTAKFGVGLFLANLISIFIGTQFLKDVDPEMQVGFQFVSLVVNAVFAMLYLSDRLKKNTDTVVSKIKEVLKKKE
jgi:hypothetical protein